MKWKRLAADIDEDTRKNSGSPQGEEDAKEKGFGLIEEDKE